MFFCSKGSVPLAKGRFLYVFVALLPPQTDAVRPAVLQQLRVLVFSQVRGIYPVGLVVAKEGVALGKGIVVSLARMLAVECLAANGNSLLRSAGVYILNMQEAEQTDSRHARQQPRQTLAMDACIAAGYTEDKANQHPWREGQLQCSMGQMFYPLYVTAHQAAEVLYYHC